MNLRSAVLLLCCSASAQAGVSITLSRGGTRTQLLQLEGNKLRVEADAAGKLNAQIFDGDSGKFYALDDADRTYRVLDKQSMTQMREKMLSSLPPERRKMIEERMKAVTDAPAPKFEFKATGEKKTVAGFACEGYRELVDGKPTAQGCYAPWNKVGITKANMEVFHKMADLFTSMGAGHRAADAIAQRFEHSPGLPVERVRLDEEGKPTGDVETLVSVKHDAVPAARFQVPAGYTEASFGSMGGPGGPGGRPLHGGPAGAVPGSSGHEGAPTQE